MTPIERTALIAAFTAAAVVAGISLSLVPNVELVTLVVFAAGVLLGPSGGALVGALGMVLYVFANVARGFPPSPLPVLAAQSGGMAVAGLAGAGWRVLWDRPRGVQRPVALAWLGVVGAVCAAFNQVLLNLVYAFLMLGDNAGFWRSFGAGMGFGAMQIVFNGIVFALAGPQVILLLRRLARSRGWWRVAVVLAALGLAPLSAGALGSPTSSAPDSVRAESQPTPVSPEPSRSQASPTAGGRILEIHPAPLWAPLAPNGSDRLGSPTFPQAGGLDGLSRARGLHSGVYTAWDRFALGWGRTRAIYDGVPLSGPVHARSEPPDVPLTWPGGWRERFSAAGTELELAPPPARVDRPQSQISLTTGSFGRRTAEFVIHRNLSPVNVAVNLLDREHGRVSSGTGISDVDADRLWVRVESAPGRRPDWSLDVSDGTREHRMDGGSRLAQNARRLQATLSGPTLGGETRLAVQVRREAVKTSALGASVEELLFDGFTTQALWAAPGGVSVEARWDRDRRRGVLADSRTFDGFRGILRWMGSSGLWSWGIEAGGGNQEPWGATWEGGVVVAAATESWHAALDFSRTESLPPLVEGLDRATPEFGLPEYLRAVEEAAAPEVVSAVRLETGVENNGTRASVGGWLARQENYMFESNPLWAAVLSSPYALARLPGRSADILGAYADLRIPLAGGFYATGSGRIHNRDLSDVPYLARWWAEGALHWHRIWFGGTLDLDASLGGSIIGERENPVSERYPVSGIGFVRLDARIDSGAVTFAVENLADALPASDFRAEDTVTPLPVAGREILLALTLYLWD